MNRPTISLNPVKLTRKPSLHRIRGKDRVQIRIRDGTIRLNSLRPVQLSVVTDAGTSDIDSINKGADTSTSDTDNNNRDLNENETRRQIQRMRKKGPPKTFPLQDFEILCWCPVGPVLPHGEKVPL